MILLDLNNLRYLSDGYLKAWLLLLGPYLVLQLIRLTIWAVSELDEQPRLN